MKVKSYIDNNYYVCFGMYFVLCFVMTIITIVLDVSKGYLIFSLVLLVLLLLLWYLFYYRSYDFADDYFEIRVGCFAKRFYYKDITKCYITNNNIPSYATSYRRICVEFKDKKIYISPSKMDEVLDLIIKKTTPKKKTSPKKTTKKTKTTKGAKAKK